MANAGMTPLTDMGTQTYFGFPGELYENYSNDVPADQSAEGLARTSTIVPLNTSGVPDPEGKIVLLSIGMSNASDEWCGTASDCTSPSGDSLMALAAADSDVNHTTLQIVNGAEGGQDAKTWISPTDANYDMVRDQRLAPLGLTEQQVQVVWIKEADEFPTVSLPSTSADAYTLETYLGDILRAVRVRYPNIKEVFISSRIYGGYATTPLNPEPYAYESGFAVKWLIQAQIDQMRNGVIDPHAGDLNYNIVAPWVVWAAYLWADGTTPRDDGLTWQRSDFQNDGTHPSASGIHKVGELLLNFFLGSPFTACWFTAAGSCASLSPSPTPTPPPTMTATALPTISSKPTATPTAPPMPTDTATPSSGGGNPTVTNTVEPATPTPLPSPTPTSTPSSKGAPTTAPTSPPPATASPQRVTLTIAAKPSVRPGQMQSISIESMPNTVVKIRVVYPNGDHQSHEVITDVDGHAAYSYRQGASKITRTKFTSQVVASAGSGSQRIAATTTYRIGFGAIDVSVEPRSIAPDKKLHIFVHAKARSRVVVSLIRSNGHRYPDTLRGRTGRKGFAAMSFRVPAGIQRGSPGKFVVVAGFASGHPRVFTRTTFTVS